MNKKSHTFLLVAFVSFIGTAVVFLYTLYGINQQGVLYAESKRLIGEHTAKEASFNTVQGLLASTKADREQIKNLFIEEKDTITFISEIEKNAKIVGVSLITNELSITPTVTDVNGIVTPAQLKVGFDFKGSQNDTWEFITLLENIPYHKKITDVSYVKTDANIWSANVKMYL